MRQVRVIMDTDLMVIFREHCKKNGISPRKKMTSILESFSERLNTISKGSDEEKKLVASIQECKNFGGKVSLLSISDEAFLPIKDFATRNRIFLRDTYKYLLQEYLQSQNIDVQEYIKEISKAAKENEVDIIFSASVEQMNALRKVCKENDMSPASVYRTLLYWFYHMIQESEKNPKREISIIKWVKTAPNTKSTTWKRSKVTMNGEAAAVIRVWLSKNKISIQSLCQWLTELFLDNKMYDIPNGSYFIRLFNMGSDEPGFFLCVNEANFEDYRAISPVYFPFDPPDNYTTFQYTDGYISMKSASTMTAKWRQNHHEQDQFFSPEGSPAIKYSTLQRKHELEQINKRRNKKAPDDQGEKHSL